MTLIKKHFGHLLLFTVIVFIGIQNNSLNIVLGTLIGSGIALYLAYNEGLKSSILHIKDENYLVKSLIFVSFGIFIIGNIFIFKKFNIILLSLIGILVIASIYALLYFISQKHASEMDFLNPPSEKVYIGHVDQGIFPKAFFIPEYTRMLHGIAFGQSGSTKTEGVLYPQLEHDIRTGKVIFIIDPKGDRKVRDRVYSYCLKHKRQNDFHYFSLSMPEYSHKYNPFAFGNASQRKDKFISVLETSEPYYKKIGSLEFLKLLEKLGPVAMLEEIIKDFPEDDKELRGLRADLELLKRTEFAELLNTNISILDIYEKNKVFFFSLDEDTYPIMSKFLGKVLLNDLKALSGHIQGKISEASRKDVTLIVDEIASFVSEEFLNFLSKARSANFRVFMATQSTLGDFEKIGIHLLRRLLDNTSIKIFMAGSDPDSVEYSSKVIGTREILKETKQVQGKVFNISTGVGSLRGANEFIVSPNAIKRLQRGEGYIYIREGVLLQKLNFDFSLHDKTKKMD